MAHRIIQMYYETTHGFLNLYIELNSYTEEDKIKSKFKGSIVVRNDERVAEEITLNQTTWNSSFMSTLDEGIQLAFKEGAIKLLFYKELEDSNYINSLFYEK
jgi:hypothetical protein